MFSKCLAKLDCGVFHNMPLLEFFRIFCKWKLVTNHGRSFDEKYGKSLEIQKVDFLLVYAYLNSLKWLSGVFIDSFIEYIHDIVIFALALQHVPEPQKLS